MQALALLYHDVVPSGAFGTSGFNLPGADRYKLTVAAFDQHLAAIAAAVKHNPVRITDDNCLESFLFTVDDGGSSAMHVSDRLESRGWHAHFFITTNYIGTSGFLTAAELRELRARGHVIGSHSCSHPMPMWSCTVQQLLEEWRRSREKLEQILGEPVCAGSVPGGFYCREIGQAAAESGFAVLFNSEPTRGVCTVGGCRILGRYVVLQNTPAAVAARLAAGDPVACGKQQAFWAMKKLLKKIAPRQYAAARTYVLGSSPEPPVSSGEERPFSTTSTKHL